MDYSIFEEFVKQVFTVTGHNLREYYTQSRYTIDLKPDSTPVTDADKRTEEYLRRAIHEKFPGTGIIAEEFDNENETAEYVWVLDPIDGTKSFISKVPLFST